MGEEEVVQEVNNVLAGVSLCDDPKREPTITYDQMLDCMISGKASMAFLFGFDNVISYRNGHKAYFFRVGDGFGPIRNW